MKPLQIIYAPNDIFAQKAEKVEKIDDAIREMIARMFKTIEVEQAVGLGANMVGILKRIIVVDTREEGRRYAMINPEIISKSKETQTFDEASISFPGVLLPVERSKEIEVKYLDENAEEKLLKAEGFLATVIQHEIDYLDGKTIIDSLSRMKKDRVFKKIAKLLKAHPPHVHTEHCNH